MAAGDRLHEKAGMSIKDIRQYIELAMQGNDTIDTRLAMFRHQREVLEAQMAELQHTMSMVDYKCWYYETAQATGTIDTPKYMPLEQIPSSSAPSGRNCRKCRRSKTLSVSFLYTPHNMTPNTEKARSSRWETVLSAFSFCRADVLPTKVQIQRWNVHPAQSRPQDSGSRPASKAPW